MNVINAIETAEYAQPFIFGKSYHIFGHFVTLSQSLQYA